MDASAGLHKGQKAGGGGKGPDNHPKKGKRSRLGGV